MTIFTTLSVTNVPIHFRMTLIKGFIREMRKQKVTKLRGIAKITFT